LQSPLHTSENVVGVGKVHYTAQKRYAKYAQGKDLLIDLIGIHKKRRTQG